MGLEGGSTQTTQSYFKGDKRFGVLGGGGWQRQLSVWKTVRLLFSVASSGPFSSPRPGRAGREPETTVNVGEWGTVMVQALKTREPIQCLCQAWTL